MVRLRPSSRAYAALSKRTKPYSLRTGAFAASASAGSLFLSITPFASQPANSVGRTWVDAAAGIGAAVEEAELGATGTALGGSAAETVAQTRNERAMTTIRRSFDRNFIQKKAHHATRLDYRQPKKVSSRAGLASAKTRQAPPVLLIGWDCLAGSAITS